MAEGIDTIRIQIDKEQLNTSQTQLGVLKEFKNAFNTQAKNISNSFKSFGKTLNLSSLQNKLTNIFMTAGKSFTNKIHSAGASLSGAFSKIKGTFSKFNIIGNVKDKVKEKVSKVKDKITTFMGKDLESLQKKFFKLWNDPKKITKLFSKQLKKDRPVATTKEKGGGSLSILSSIAKVISKIGGLISKIAPGLTLLCNPVGLGIAIAIGLSGPVALICGTLILLGTMLGDKFVTVVDKLLDALPGLLNKGVTAIKSLMLSIFDALPEIILKALDGVKTILIGLFDTIPTIVPHLVSCFVDIFPQIIVGIVEGIASAIGLLFEKLPSILGGLFKSAFGGLVGGIGKTVGGAIGGIVGGVKSLFGSDKEKEVDKETLDLYKSFYNPVLSELAHIHTTLLKFHKELTELFKFSNTLKEQEIHKKELEKTKSITQQSTVKSVVDKGADVAKKGINWISDKLNKFFGSDDKNNNFSKLIENFTKAQTDIKNILDEIKKGVLQLSGNNLVTTQTPANNSATPSDGKNLNGVNINVKSTTNLSEIITSMTTIGTKLDMIVQNTALTERGERKKGSAWAIE